MLVRCKKCGELFQSEEGKCPRCNEPGPTNEEINKAIEARANADRETVRKEYPFVMCGGLALIIGIIWSIVVIVSENLHFGLGIVMVGPALLLASIVLLGYALHMGNVASSKRKSEESITFLPKCPTCGSMDIELVPSLSKAVGDKRFKCKHCGAMW